MWSGSTSTGCEAFVCAAAERQGDLLQQELQTEDPPSVREGQRLDLFGERPLRALDVAAEEAPDFEVDRNPLPTSRPVGEPSSVTAVHSSPEAVPHSEQRAARELRPEV
jgi:hypothetical protein